MGKKKLETIEEEQLDEQALVSEPNGEEQEQAPVPAPRLPTPSQDDAPEWAILPANLQVPKGRQVVFLRFPPALTGNPFRGERQCIVWTLNDGEEKLANDRTAGNMNRAPAEFTKQMIRAVDGVRVDWSKAKGPGSVDEFWREIGPKGRNLLIRIYTQLHLATDAEVTDFFESCVAVRTAG